MRGGARQEELGLLGWLGTELRKHQPYSTPFVPVGQRDTLVINAAHRLPANAAAPSGRKKVKRIPNTGEDGNFASRRQRGKKRPLSSKWAAIAAANPAADVAASAFSLRDIPPLSQLPIEYATESEASAEALVQLHQQDDGKKR